MLHEYMASLPSNRFPQLSALAEHYGASDADARFELLLDIYVDGLPGRGRAAGRGDPTKKGAAVAAPLHTPIYTGSEALMRPLIRPA